MASTSTGWIQPGTDVLVYCKGDDRTPPTPRRTTIAKVATKTFTVDDITDRIYVDTQQSKRIGSTWSGWTYRVVPIDSDEARAVLAKNRRDEADYRARLAADKWRLDRTRANRLAAIKALQAVDDA